MKETKYAGTQTEKNLMAAFAGESEARNKYTYSKFQNNLSPFTNGIKNGIIYRGR